MYFFFNLCQIQICCALFQFMVIKFVSSIFNICLTAFVKQLLCLVIVSFRKLSFQKNVFVMSFSQQHYMVVHAEKKFHCERCRAGFGLETHLNRHVKQCQIVFRCQQCGNIYKNSHGLHWHCQKTGHPYLLPVPNNK